MHHSTHCVLSHDIQQVKTPSEHPTIIQLPQYTTMASRVKSILHYFITLLKAVLKSESTGTENKGGGGLSLA
jgi:hypothetical protein